MVLRDANASVASGNGQVIERDVLAPSPASARRARRFVADALARAGRGQHIEVAELLVSELVTNAVVHAAGDLVLLVAITGSDVRVEVRDLSPELPVMRPRNTHADSGRGMQLVQELSDAWGAELDGGGKVVWFELRDAPVPQLDPVGLPRVLHDAPAAILLVDLDTRQVTYASAQAQELAPDVTLPVSLKRWSAAAGLRGASPVNGDGTLARLASGVVAAGEPVTVGAEGDGVRVLWGTGFPLSGSAVGGSALVVLLQTSGLELRESDPAMVLQQMRDRAVIATDISFTISDPAQPDNPLVWTNPAFTRVTGYGLEESVGRNCRFLQGPGTDPAAVKEIRDAIARRRPVTVTLLNYRADGMAFWNELSLSPVLDGKGELTHFVGVQADVTARVQAELEREAAYRAERAARAEAEAARVVAEAARAQMALLGEATSVITATPRVDEALPGLLDLLVPDVADWASIDLVEPSGRPRRAYLRHPDPETAAQLRSVGDTAAAAAIRRVSEQGPFLWKDVTEELIATDVPDPAFQELYRRIQPRSRIVVPLRARGNLLGALMLVTSRPTGRLLHEADLDLAIEVGQRAAQAVDLARLYAAEHDTALALQRSLLPELSQVDGLRLATRYLTAAETVEIGGDWYDVLGLPDGAVGIAIGDVTGHDLAAAAAMGQLRSVLRSYAWEGKGAADVLDRMDRLVQGLGMAQLATAVYARLEVPAGGADGARVLRYANAGHLPPLLRRAQGGAEFLRGGRSVLLGAVPDAPRGEGQAALRPGDTLLLYTDGLVERRGEDIDDGLNALREVAEAHRAEAGPEALCDRVLERLQIQQTLDDVAILAVQLR